jgi:hypothetical protein
MKPYFFATIIFFIINSATIAQTNQENRDILAELGKEQTGIIARQDKLAVVYCSLINHVLVSAKEFDSSRPIYYGFALTTNKVSVLFLLRPEYGLRISVVNEKGETVAPTRQGAKFGRYFDVLKGFNKDAIDPTKGKAHGRAPNWQVVGPRDDISFLGSFAIPAPDELFDFKTAGKYVVKIETACFLKQDFIPNIRSDTTNYTLVKFPPVKLQVIKKEVEK